MEDLVDDVVEDILLLLPPEDLASLCLVNKRLYSFAAKPSHWPRSRTRPFAHLHSPYHLVMNQFFHLQLFTGDSCFEVTHSVGLVDLFKDTKHIKLRRLAIVNTFILCLVFQLPSILLVIANFLFPLPFVLAQDEEFSVSHFGWLLPGIAGLCFSSMFAATIGSRKLKDVFRLSDDDDAFFLSTLPALRGLVLTTFLLAENSLLFGVWLKQISERVVISNYVIFSLMVLLGSFYLSCGWLGWYLMTSATYGTKYSFVYEASAFGYAAAHQILYLASLLSPEWFEVILGALLLNILYICIHYTRREKASNLARPPYSLWLLWHFPFVWIDELLVVSLGKNSRYAIFLLVFSILYFRSRTDWGYSKTHDKLFLAKILLGPRKTRSLGFAITEMKKSIRKCVSGLLLYLFLWFVGVAWLNFSVRLNILLPL